MTQVSPRPLPLADLVAGLVPVPSDVLVSDVTIDSRSVVAGGLFLALKGRTSHGLQFAEQAVAQGARAVLYDDSPGISAPAFGPGAA